MPVFTKSNILECSVDLDAHRRLWHGQIWLHLNSVIYSRSPSSCTKYCCTDPCSEQVQNLMAMLTPQQQQALRVLAIASIASFWTAQTMCNAAIVIRVHAPLADRGRLICLQQEPHFMLPWISMPTQRLQLALQT